MKPPPAFTERILTLHPEGKSGVNIEKSKYDQMRDAIMAVLADHPEIGFSECNRLVAKLLDGKFDGKVSWYFVSVKMDLETRGVLSRFKKGGLQMIRKN
ncbi:MAG: hypothetical protein U0176_10900 [Bacteroidia bacterium]